MIFPNNLHINDLNNINIYQLLSKSSYIDDYTYVFYFEPSYDLGPLLQNNPYYGIIKFDKYDHKIITFIFIKKLLNQFFAQLSDLVDLNSNLIGLTINVNNDYLENPTNSNENITINATNIINTNLMLNKLLNIKYNSLITKISLEKLFSKFEFENLTYINQLNPNSSILLPNIPNRTYLLYDGNNVSYIHIDQFNQISYTNRLNHITFNNFNLNNSSNTTYSIIGFNKNIFVQNHNFIDLNDTPNSYFEKKLHFLNVNKYETNIDFYNFGDLGFIIPYSNFLGVYSSPPTPNKLFDSYYDSTTNKLFFNIDNSWVEYNWQNAIQLAPEWPANLRINLGQLEIKDGADNWHPCYPLVGAKVFHLDSSNPAALDNTNYSKKYYILPETSIRLTNSNHLPIVFSYNEQIAFDVNIGIETSSVPIWDIRLRISGILLSHVVHSYIVYYSNSFYYGTTTINGHFYLKDTTEIVPYKAYENFKFGFYNEIVVSYSINFNVGYDSLSIVNVYSTIPSNSYWLGILYTHYGNILQIQKIHIRRTL